MASRGYYIVGPSSLSLYRRLKGDGDILLFGDTHDTLGGDTNREGLETIPVSEYIRLKLDESGDLHVYAEIPKGESMFEDSPNRELSRIDELAKTYHGRIHNIDNRLSDKIIERELYYDPTKHAYEEVAKIVRNYIKRREPLLLPQFERGKIEAEPEYDDIANMDDEDFDPDDPIYYENPDLPYNVAKVDMMRPMVEANMSYIINRNPHNAKDMIFYVGDGHKTNLEDIVLDKHPNFINLYKRNVGEEDNPLSSTRF